MISSTSANCTDSDVYSNLLIPLADSIKTNTLDRPRLFFVFFLKKKRQDSFLKIRLIHFKEATKKSYEKLNTSKGYTSECLHWR